MASGEGARIDATYNIWKRICQEPGLSQILLYTIPLVLPGLLAAAIRGTLCSALHVVAQYPTDEG